MKKIIIILSALLLIGFLTVFSFANTVNIRGEDDAASTYSDVKSGSVEASGKLGTKITWTLYEDGEMYVEGTGAMYNFGNYPYGPFRRSGGALGEMYFILKVNMTEGITSIGESTFEGCDYLKSVEIPKEVTSIGNYAFKDCSSLTSVTIPEGVTSIENSAFKGCSSLTSVTIPEIVTSIGSSAFEDCSSLASITIPKGVTSIDYSVFEGCSSLTSVALPKSITSIYDRAFSGCRSLTSIIIPEGVTKIGEQVFMRCVGLEEIKIPDSVTDIGSYTLFSGCSGLKNIIIPEWVTRIGYAAFSGCTGLTSITIPEGVTEIGDYAFSGCTGLTSITIPEGVTKIGDYAFSKAYNLEKIELPASTNYFYKLFARKDSLSDDELQNGKYSIIMKYTYNGGGAYYTSSKLKEITINGSKIPDKFFEECNLGKYHIGISESVKSIGKNIFNEAGEVEIEFLGDAPDYSGTTAADMGKYSKVHIVYHNGKQGWTSPEWHGINALCIGETDYSTLNDSNYNNQGILFTLNESAGTATVGDNSDTSCNSGYLGGQSVDVIIPDTVVKNGKTYKVVRIGKNAFSGNNNIPSITLGKYVSSVDVTAFRKCTNFKEFRVSDGNVYYSTDNGVLYDKGKMYLYIYPQAIENTSFTVPETVRTIGTYAFAYAKNIEDLYVGTNVTSIGSRAFFDCTSLKSVTLPFTGGDSSGGNISYIFGVLDGSRSRDELPSSMKTITILGGKLSSSAFSNCSNVEKIILPDFEQSNVPYDCFRGCSNLKYIQWGNSDKAEEGVINVPESYTSIESSAFSGCTSFSNVIINKNIEKINSYAFSGCTGLVEFSVDKDNKQYMSDKWGVLYTKDQSTLMYYPTQRIWPYYNVSYNTTTIGNCAFYGTSNLVNLFIPKNVTKFDDRGYNSSNCLYQMNGATICVYKDSDADTYCKSNDLTAWYMDNYEMQGIHIYSLPEQTEFDTADDVDFKGLYMASYGGKELQLEDYSIEYDPNKIGKQTVTVTSDGYNDTFEIVIRGNASSHIVRFSGVSVGADKYYAAIYDANGKQIRILDANVENGEATVVISSADYARMCSAKLFAVKAGSMAPAGDAVTTDKKSA